MAVTAEPIQRLEQIWASPTGIASWFTAVNHKAVGKRYIATAFVFFLIGGINALLMRTQLARPRNDFLSADTYNELFTMHGTTMMFLFAVPMVEGIAAYLVPLMVGARDMAFPRLNAYGYWCYVLGGILLYSSFWFGSVPDDGWFAYVPLSGPEFSPGREMDFWLLGITFAEISAVVAAIELLVTILKFRTPGMSLNRMPIFVWAILATMVAIIFGFPPLIVGSVLLELDRAIGTLFYDPELGGSALLWQHLFWTFGHPEVYIQFLPATGVVSTVIPVFVRRPIAGYLFVALAIMSTAILSFGLWVHHMFAVGLPLIAMSFFTAASMSIAIPSGVQIFAWVATIWGGRPVWKTPFLFALGFIVIFVLGGITGVMVALVPFDWQVHDTYFVVAHFHYVLIGGVVFPIFAALYYWFPKISGRLLSERLGVINFALLFIGFNVTFFPMHIVGLLGMPRRVYTYDPGLGWGTLNFIETLGAFVIATSVAVFMLNVLISLRNGAEAGDDPWGANTLEWATTSPPQPYNFATNLMVHSRDPLWDEQSERDTPLVSTPHRERRETLGTSVMDAVPTEIIWLPKPSISPFVAAIGTGAVFVGLLLKSVLLIGLGGVIVLVAALAWAWPGEQERSEWGDDSTETGLPLTASGRSSSSWWGIVSALAVLGTMLVSLVASYFYIRSSVVDWPLGNIDEPQLLLPSVGFAMLLASVVPMSWVSHGAGRLDTNRLSLGLAVAIGLGIAFLAILAVDYWRLDFQWDTNVYGSLVYVLGGFQALLTVVGLIMVGYTLARSVSGHFEVERDATIDNTALFWYFIVAASAVTYSVLYLYPQIPA